VTTAQWGPIPGDGGDAGKIIAKFAEAGIEHDKLAGDLQCQATELFVKVCNEMFDSIGLKSAASEAAGYVGEINRNDRNDATIECPGYSISCRSFSGGGDGSSTLL
jgi:hypothetical protein